MILQRVLYSLALVGIFHLVTGRRSSTGSSKVDSSDPAELWPGHLEPLGAKAVQRAIPVIEGFLSPKTFYVDHVLGSLPVVFRNGAKLSPAFKSWSDTNLRLRPEAETTIIDVEIRKKEDRKQPTQRMKFTEFLERYQTEDEYMVDTLPKFLRKDVVIPPPLVCDEILQRISDVVMWFSSGGTKSHLHNDDTDNINCLFSGQKDILFLNYTQYRHQFHFDHPDGSYSSVDVDSVDMIKYPGLRNVEFYKAKLFPGDCIYIPYKWIHQVNSIGRNIAVNVWFDHSCETVPSPEICGPTDRRLTIADVELDVERPLGFEEDFEEDQPSAVEMLIDTLKDEEIQLFTQQDFTALLQKKLTMLSDLRWNEECDALSREAFELLDLTEDGLLDKEDLSKLQDTDEIFTFQLESKLFMLSDIAHEQEVQERLRKMEKTKKPPLSDDPNVFVQQVEPLNLDDIDWGDDGKKDGKKMDEKKTDQTREDKKAEDIRKEEELTDHGVENPEDIDDDSGVSVKVEL
ncbi:bifunctional peptidase and arginyl-hydroxylase JMJD5-like [Lytechinus variegatus]|uniref:bifunctional peptidase and arginyl-hydroxylase JMJD5-like n=1 Tax=Lytechinus variegatus TaxID=7654 RepID=UPI001BB28497|nr:bifunctional peptidase and arginyl-hydroxylase JMJD5-like [Lytechinus variegatus]